MSPCSLAPWGHSADKARGLAAWAGEAEASPLGDCVLEDCHQAMVLTACDYTCEQLLHLSAP